MTDLNGLSTTNTCTYMVVCTHLQENENITSEATRIAGVMKGFSILRQDSSIVRISQVRLQKVTNVNIRYQAKATALLEKYKLIKVHRNKRSKNILYYEFFDVNWHLLCFAKEFYENHVENGTMEFLHCNRPLYGVYDKEKFPFLTGYETQQNALDLEKIKGKIKEFEAKDPFGNYVFFPFKTTPLESENLSRTPDKFIGPKNKDKNKSKDTFKNPKVSSSVLPDAQEKPQLKRRTNIPQKQPLRDQLKNVPLSKPTKNNPRRSVVDNYHNTRPFFLVKQCWNKKPNLKKISDLKEKQNKTLDNSVLAVKALLSGSLFEKGMIDVDGHKIFPTLPANFDVAKEKITVHWLLEKIETFHEIITDQYSAPANKTPLTQMSLFDFIMGKLVRQERFTSVLFQYCCGEKKTVQVDNYPKMTNFMIERFHLVTGKEQTLSAKDKLAFARTGLKLLERKEEYFRRNKIKVFCTEDIKTKDTMNGGEMDELVASYFKPLKEQWGAKIRDMKPSYFASDHAWEIYTNR